MTTDTWLPTAPAPVQVLGAVTETVADLDDVLWAARPAGELLDTVRELERLRSVLDRVQLQVVAEVDARDAARSEGWGSTRDFVTAVTGGRRGSGRAIVALARALATDRSRTGEVLGLGLISRAQAEAVVAAVDRLPVDPALRAAGEELLLAEARTRDASELAGLGRHLLTRLDPDGEERRDERALDREERAAHLGRFLSIAEDGIGGVRLRGRGTVEDAAWLKAALMPLAAPTPTTPPSSGCAHDGRDPRDHGARMWDALVEAARRLAGADLLPDSHGVGARVVVTVDHDSLARSVGEATVSTGEQLSASAARRLACDAEVLPVVLGSRSQVLDVGRSSRLVTAALWTALVVRDRHCAFPGCRRVPLACDAHHVVHWADGGSTSLDNLVLLCRRHHTVIHQTPWGVRIRANDWRPEFFPPGAISRNGPIRQRPLRE